jgi:ribosomal protein L40E
MEAAFVTILIFLGVIAISAVLFVVWLVWEVLRLMALVVWRVFFGRRAAPTMIETRPADVVVCPNPRCRGENPTVARFCRRCGSGMPSVQHVLARRAAMW